MKTIWIMLSMLTATVSLTAQNEVDALRYSYLGFGGTARFMATGGAFGALGADISTLHTNPAGIGLFKSGELTFSPTLFYGRTESSYNGNSLDDYKTNFNIGNLGLVSVSKVKNSEEGKGWQNFQFGFDLVRNNNFNNQISTIGRNTSSSLLTVWNARANGKTVSNLDSYSTFLAYDTYLLNLDSASGSAHLYTNAIPNGGVMQTQGLSTAGYMNEWAFSFGGNYADKLYLGVTFGFPYLRYSENKNYSESALADSIGFNEFRTMTVNDHLDVKGQGFNVKFGVIYKPVNFLRIGLAYHTPTNYYSMSENYSTDVSSTFTNGDHYTSQSPLGSFDYRLTTPSRVIGSLACLVGTRGFVSGEYELVDYSQTRLRSSNPEDFMDANNQIQKLYRATGNLRLGAEYRLDNISLRAGYANYGSPFESSVNDASRTCYTFGIGFRGASYYLDFASVLTYAKEDYYLYQLPDVINPVVNKTHDQSFIMTFGIKF